MATMGEPLQSLRHGALTRGILAVLAAGAVVVTFAALPGLALALAPFVSRRRYSPSTLRRTIDRLERRRLVRFRKRGNQTAVVLTDAGRRRHLGDQLALLRLEHPARWDGRWRLVVFDIPEERKAAREALRAKLRHLEFYQLQRSVFITPYDCRAAIDLLKEFYNVDDHVHFLEVTYVDCAELLRTEFRV